MEFVPDRNKKNMALFDTMKKNLALLDKYELLQMRLLGQRYLKIGKWVFIIKDYEETRFNADMFAFRFSPEDGELLMCKMTIEGLFPYFFEKFKNRYNKVNKCKICNEPTPYNLCVECSDKIKIVIEVDEPLYEYKINQYQLLFLWAHKLLLGTSNKDCNCKLCKSTENLYTGGFYGSQKIMDLSFSWLMKLVVKTKEISLMEKEEKKPMLKALKIWLKG